MKVYEATATIWERRLTDCTSRDKKTNRWKRQDWKRIKQGFREKI